ncbi:Regulatory protein BlaR1 [Pirellula sp. SH-Sr6A]|uniref:M56 family metallopeptidase n=1 Tax=Pirellula sp. SH-Sr6A TaxID=1632865 RepID=UPI00078C510E|nr:M56 family metallopeptidase [Pirellula sp. SH-Sr6A]AMV33191.1 Regulatory protein BlaR1 [Pirellula sp. SH-Sr6A]
MTVLFQLGAQSDFLVWMFRAFAFVTFVLIGAWLLARFAGRNNPAFRSTVWTTSILLTLLFPLMAWLGDVSEMQGIQIPTLGYHPRIESGIDRSTIASPNSPNNAPRISQPAAQSSPRSRTPAAPSEAISHNNPNVDIAPAPETKSATDPTMVPAGTERWFEPIAIESFIFIWGMGVVFGIARWALTMAGIRRLLAKARFQHAPRLERIAQSARESIGMRWQPTIGTSEHANSAFAVFHGLRGCIVLPERMVRELSDKELKDVITHECAHLHRFDPVLGMIQAIAMIVYWPHPLIYLAKREFIKSREEVCDNYVMRNSDCIEYAKTLLSIAERGVLGSAVAGATSFTSYAMGLEDRIAGLLCGRRLRSISTSWHAKGSIVGIFTALALLCATSTFGLAEDQGVPSFPWHSERMQVLGDERGRSWGKTWGGLDVHPDGHQLVTADNLGNVYLWNSNTLVLEKHFRFDPSVQSARYSWDGNALVVLRAEKPMLWIDLKSGFYTTKESSDSPLPAQITHKWFGDRRSFLVGLQLLQISKAGELEKPPSVELTLEEFSTGKPTPTYSIKALSNDGQKIAGVREVREEGQDEQGRRTSRVVDGNVIIMQRFSGFGKDTFRRQFVLNQPIAVQAMAFSNNNRLLAMSTADGKTTVFDITGDWPVSQAVFEHSGHVQTLCFHPKGKMLTVGATDLELWALDEDQATKLVSISRNRSNANLFGGGGQSALLSPNGDALFFLDGDYGIRRWDLTQSNNDSNDAERPRYDESHLLASRLSTNRLISFEHNSYNWRRYFEEPATGEVVVRDLKELDAPPKSLFKIGPDPAWGMCMSNDQRRIAFFTQHESKTALELWQVSIEGSQRLDRMELEASLPVSSGGLAFSPDGTTLVSGGKQGAIQVWDVSQGKLRQRAAIVPDPELCDIRGLRFSSDGSTFASIESPGGVNLWRLETQDGALKKLRTIGNSIDGVACVHYSNDGTMLATGDDQGRIKLWPLDNANASPIACAHHDSRIHSLEFRSTNDEILSCGEDGQVIVWDIKKTKIIRAWRYPGPVFDARFDATESKIVTANSNGSIYVCDYR